MAFGYAPGGGIQAGGGKQALFNAYAPQQNSTIAGPSDALTNQYKLYNSGVQQNAAMLDELMHGYRNVLNTPSQATPIQNRTYTPQTYDYSPTAASQQSISNLGSLAATGGYSGQDIADIRARGISPIRAIYANAQRDIDRQRALQGGYSPNYGALKAKMARELSSQLSDKVTDINAGIAQNVAQNKIAVAPSYASAAGSENALRNQYGAAKANTGNEAQMFNINNALQTGMYNNSIANQDRTNQLQALGGMSSLYSATPALTALYGQQAAQAANQVAAQNQGLLNAGSSAVAQTAPQLDMFGRPLRRLG